MVILSLFVLCSCFIALLSKSEAGEVFVWLQLKACNRQKTTLIRLDYDS